MGERPENVVLDLRDTTSSSKSKIAYNGMEAKVLQHTSVNGWVLVAVGSEVIKWRVGQWIAIPDDPCNEHVQKYDKVVQITATDVRDKHLQKQDKVVLRPQKQSGKPEYAGQVAQVLWESANRGWVKVKVDSQEIKWRIGHWVNIDELGGGTEGSSSNYDECGAVQRYGNENVPPDANGASGIPELIEELSTFSRHLKFNP